MTEAQIREQQAREFLLKSVLSIGTLIIAGGVTFIILFWEVPEKNEIIFGTILGFVFGNMVGPVWRQFFAGADAETKAATDKQADTLKAAVDKLPASAPTTEETR